MKKTFKLLLRREAKRGPKRCNGERWSWFSHLKLKILFASLHLSGQYYKSPRETLRLQKALLPLHINGNTFLALILLRILKMASRSF